MVMDRCCVSRVLVGALTGRLNGAGMDGFTSQSHIKELAGRDVVRNVGLDTTLSPGVWSAVPLCRSGTTTFRQRSVVRYPPGSECI